MYKKHKKMAINTHSSHNDEDDHGDDRVHSSDIEIEYILECKNPTQIKTITATGFDSFPAIETMDAVFLGNASQKASRLTRNAKFLKVD